MQSVSAFSVFPSIAVQIYLARKVAALCMPIRVLKSGIFEIWKNYQNPEIYLGFSHFFQIFKISLLSTPKGRGGHWSFFALLRFRAREREAKTRARKRKEKRARKKAKVPSAKEKKREFALFPPLTVNWFQRPKLHGRGKAMVLSKMYS
jgi:hypothetical protein